MSPLAPPADDPDETDTEPESPELAAPVSIRIEPVELPGAELRVTEPDLAVPLCPLETRTEPPVDCELAPAERIISPPIPDDDSPTEKTISPLDPDEDEPVRNVNMPDSPSVASPVASPTAPLEPSVREVAEVIDIEPLVLP
jgi:hypothetical protein